mmetsp:Transcript_12204/g.12026  ORF Transcript_12204/g.12026 Transcript_12204/m.12026 type:complete len:251 (-) Transcript_12204:522-1274(-)
MTYVRCACFQLNFTFIPLKLIYLVISYIFFDDQMQIVHYLILEVTFFVIVSNIHRSMTLCDMIIVSVLNAMYLMFPLDSIINRDQRLYIAGNNNHNILSFSPWIFLNLVIAFVLVLNKVGLKKETIIIVSGTISAALTLGLVIKVVPLKVMISFLTQVFLKDVTPKLLLYMIITLVAGLMLAGVFLRNPLYVPFYMIRKWFHLIALYLFIPATFLNFKMMVFAFNCVTVIMILIELLRFYYFQYSLNKTF